MQEQINKFANTQQAKNQKLIISSKTIQSTEDIHLCLDFLASKDCPTWLNLDFNFENIEEDQLLNHIETAFTNVFILQKVPQGLRMNFNNSTLELNPREDKIVKNLMLKLCQLISSIRSSGYQPLPKNFTLDLRNCAINQETAEALGNILLSAPVNFALILNPALMDTNASQYIAGCIEQAPESIQLLLTNKASLTEEKETLQLDEKINAFIHAIPSAPKNFSLRFIELNINQANMLADIITQAPQDFRLQLECHSSIDSLKTLINAVPSAPKGFRLSLLLDSKNVSALTTMAKIIPSVPENFSFRCGINIKFNTHLNYYTDLLKAIQSDSPAGLKIQFDFRNQTIYQNSVLEKFCKAITNLIESGNYPNGFSIECINCNNEKLVNLCEQVNFVSEQTKIMLSTDSTKTQKYWSFKIKNYKELYLTKASQSFLNSYKLWKTYQKTESLSPIQQLMEEKLRFSGPYLFDIFQSIEHQLHNNLNDNDSNAYILNFNTAVTLLAFVREAYPEIANSHLIHFFHNHLEHYWTYLNQASNSNLKALQKNQIIAGLLEHSNAKLLSELSDFNPQDSESINNVESINFWPLENLKNMVHTVLSTCSLIDLDDQSFKIYLKLQDLNEKPFISDESYGYLLALLNQLLSNETVFEACAQDNPSVKIFKNNTILPAEWVSIHDQATKHKILEMSQTQELKTVKNAYKNAIKNNKTSLETHIDHEGFIASCMNFTTLYLKILTLKETLADSSSGNYTTFFTPSEKLNETMRSEQQYLNQINSLKEEIQLLGTPGITALNAEVAALEGIVKQKADLEEATRSEKKTKLTKVLTNLIEGIHTLSEEDSAKHESITTLSGKLELLKGLVVGNNSAGVITQILSFFIQAYEAISSVNSVDDVDTTLSSSSLFGSIRSSVSGYWHKKEVQENESCPQDEALNASEAALLNGLGDLLKTHLGISDPQQTIFDQSNLIKAGSQKQLSEEIAVHLGISDSVEEEKSYQGKGFV